MMLILVIAIFGVQPSQSVDKVDKGYDLINNMKEKDRIEALKSLSSGFTHNITGWLGMTQYSIKPLGIVYESQSSPGYGNQNVRIFSTPELRVMVLNNREYFYQIEEDDWKPFEKYSGLRFNQLVDKWNGEICLSVIDDISDKEALLIFKSDAAFVKRYYELPDGCYLGGRIPYEDQVWGYDYDEEEVLKGKLFENAADVEVNPKREVIAARSKIPNVLSQVRLYADKNPYIIYYDTTSKYMRVDPVLDNVDDVSFSTSGMNLSKMLNEDIYFHFDKNVVGVARFTRDTLSYSLFRVQKNVVVSVGEAKLIDPDFVDYGHWIEPKIINDSILTIETEGEIHLFRRQHGTNNFLLSTKVERIKQTLRGRAVFQTDVINENYLFFVKEGTKTTLWDYSVINDTVKVLEMPPGYSTYAPYSNGDRELLIAGIGSGHTFVKLNIGNGIHEDGIVYSNLSEINYPFEVTHAFNIIPAIVIVIFYLTTLIIGIILIKDYTDRRKLNRETQFQVGLVSVAYRTKELEHASKTLKRKSEIMLILGVMFSLFGVGIFSVTVTMMPEENVEKVDGFWWKAYYFGRPFVMLLFIQIFAFFFLRQYRVIFNEYKDFYVQYQRMQRYYHLLELMNGSDKISDQQKTELIEIFKTDPVGFSQISTDNQIIGSDFKDMVGEIREFVKTAKP